jgi:hypothetical protein
MFDRVLLALSTMASAGSCSGLTRRAVRAASISDDIGLGRRHNYRTAFNLQLVRRGIRQSTKARLIHGKDTEERARPVAGTRHGQEQGNVFVDVEWVDEEGYRVVGMFKQWGWAQPPRAVGEKMQAALSKPPKVLYHFGPRGRAGKGSSNG